MSLPSPPVYPVLMFIPAGPSDVRLSTSVNSGGTWHRAPVEMTCWMSQLINISLFPPPPSLSFLLLSLIVFPPSKRREHSSSSPPPAALVQPCSGGTWGPPGSRGLRDGPLHPPTSSVLRPPGTVSRGQPNQPTGARRRPGDEHAASLCRRPKTNND